MICRTNVRIRAVRISDGRGVFDYSILLEIPSGGKLTRFCLVVMFIVYNFTNKSTVMITQYNTIQYNFI